MSDLPYHIRSYRWHPCWFCGELVCVTAGVAKVCWRHECDTQFHEYFEAYLTRRLGPATRSSVNE